MCPPKFVWCDGPDEGRNLFALFRRDFELGGLPERAELYLFADTRYRLWVNGEIVGYGPARFYPSHPEFDTVDLAPFLRVGANRILVEVNHRGSNSYQAAPSRPGFIAWGKTGEHDFATPGEWRAARDASRAADAPDFSFAQGATEILDLRALDSGLGGGGEAAWAPAREIAGQDHWGALASRSVPSAAGDILVPARVTRLAPMAKGEGRVGFHRMFAVDRRAKRRARFAYALLFKAPRACRAKLGLFWGPNYFNGVPLGEEYDPVMGNRINAEVEMREGWNVLYGEPEVLAASWGYQIAWADDLGLQMALSTDGSIEGRLLVSEALDPAELENRRGGVPARPEDLDRMRGWLRPLEEIPHTDFPARECAWDRAEAPVEMEPERVTDLDLPMGDGAGAVAVFDFGREFLGHLALEIEAPEGTVVDVAADEVLRADGLVPLYRNYLVNAVDRFVCGSGCTRYEGFHERGGRYLQVTVRGEGPARIRRVYLRSALAELPVEGAFCCSDPVFNWAWEAGVRTLWSSLNEGWVDPWREQGLYLGDTYVEFWATRSCSHDLRHVRRALRLWAQGQRSDGQMCAVVPAHYTGAHPDFTLIWVLMLRDYTRLSGEVKLAGELWPALERIWESPLWRESASGLWDAEGLNVFCDWGRTRAAVGGEENAILNGFRVGALAAAAELALRLGLDERAARFRAEAERVAGAFRERLWDPATGGFSSCFVGGKRVSESAVHGNVLALLFGIAGPEQAAEAMRLVEESIDDCIRRESTVTQGSGYMELYFLHYALEMLSARGNHALAERVLRSRWGAMQRHGAITLWETLERGLRGDGSKCHGWACGPNVYLMREVLGVRMLGPDAVLIRPESPGVTWARGKWPTPHGPVEVAWSLRGETLVVDVSAPEAVSVEVAPPPCFEGRRLRANVRARVATVPETRTPA